MTNENHGTHIKVYDSVSTTRSWRDIYQGPDFELCTQCVDEVDMVIQEESAIDYSYLFRPRAHSDDKDYS